MLWLVLSKNLKSTRRKHSRGWTSAYDTCRPLNVHWLSSPIHPAGSTIWYDISSHGPPTKRTYAYLLLTNCIMISTSVKFLTVKLLKIIDHIHFINKTWTKLSKSCPRAWILSSIIQVGQSRVQRERSCEIHHLAAQNKIHAATHYTYGL